MVEIYYWQMVREGGRLLPLTNRGTAKLDNVAPTMWIYNVVKREKRNVW